MSTGTQELTKFSPQPKGESRHAARERRRAAQRLCDERESAKVRRRSGGTCEICRRQRAAEVHHFLGGHGRRGVENALAENKIHLCTPCHRAVTDKVIRLYWRNIKDRFGTLQVEQ